jgi:hypothetical protein
MIFRLTWKESEVERGEEIYSPSPTRTVTEYCPLGILLREIGIGLAHVEEEDGLMVRVEGKR